jgi:hypothetical protein
VSINLLKGGFNGEANARHINSESVFDGVRSATASYETPAAIASRQSVVNISEFYATGSSAAPAQQPFVDVSLATWVYILIFWGDSDMPCSNSASTETRYATRVATRTKGQLLHSTVAIGNIFPAGYSAKSHATLLSNML